MDTNTRRNVALATAANTIGTVARMRAVPAGAQFLALMANGQDAACEVARPERCLVCGDEPGVRCCEYGRDR